MPRKSFEDAPYNPIAADLVRDVAAAGRLLVLDRPAAPQPLQPMQQSEQPMAPVQPPPQPPVQTPLAQAIPVFAAPQTVASAAVKSYRQPEPATLEPTITKRFVLTRTENDELNEFLLRLQRQVRTKVTLSVFVRASITVAMQAEAHLMEEVRGWPVRFPSTHDALGQGAFEAEWIRCLANAIRRMPRTSGPTAR